MKIPDAKAAVDKEWKKLQTLPAWKLEKVKSKKEVIREALKNDNKVHFTSLMDLCHVKNSELEPQFQKYIERVVLRGDIVKDDPGAYAVFSEHGSSASQMTAAKVMDVIARLHEFDGRAADAISAYTQVKMEDAQNYLKFQSRNVQMYGYVFQNINGRSRGNTLKILLFLLNGIYTDTHSQDSCKRQFEKTFMELGWEKVPN